jgi:hypothetical protein
MNEHIFNPRLKGHRLPTEEMEKLDKINTDYCPGYNLNEREIESVVQEIYRNGEIGGHRL